MGKAAAASAAFRHSSQSCFPLFEPFSFLHDPQLRVSLECQQEETTQHREAGSRLPWWHGAGAASLGGLGRSASELRHRRLRCLRLWELSLIETLVLCDCSSTVLIMNVPDCVTAANLRVEMDLNNVFVCRFTQLAGAVVEMCTKFPWHGTFVQYTSGMVLLPSLNF